ncbi:MAG: outer membrane lipoprotein carrier protein LolA [Chitinophagales bacterium]|nr:outer membrane lipoprotein carrier protein LolA [Chitinophagales bacterium]MDW8273307.1 outer membrane lipoprotein carrier protein LolA [Chitinophagales bacterium]
MKFLFPLLIISALVVRAQTETKTYIEDEADIALRKMSARYEAFKTIKADFMLIITNPKLSPKDDERKLTDTLLGSVLLKSEKFKLTLPGQEIYCDGKNIWTYNLNDKEVVVDLFTENDDVFSPAKLFSFYKKGFSYQVKEKRITPKGRIIVAEMSPVNKKTSYFKIDVAMDENNYTLVETKIYSKNGTRYLYKIKKETTDIEAPDEVFSFNASKYPGVKITDLR